MAIRYTSFMHFQSQLFVSIKLIQEKTIIYVFCRGIGVLAFCLICHAGIIGEKVDNLSERKRSFSIAIVMI